MVEGWYARPANIQMHYLMPTGVPLSQWFKMTHSLDSLWSPLGHRRRGGMSHTSLLKAIYLLPLLVKCHFFMTSGQTLQLWIVHSESPSVMLHRRWGDGGRNLSMNHVVDILSDGRHFIPKRSSFSRKQILIYESTNQKY